jgi:hypothetical protein
MASTVTSESLVYETRRVEPVHKYHWPAVQLNLWMLIMLIASCLIIGVFASFISIQQTLLLPIPWCVVEDRGRARASIRVCCSSPFASGIPCPRSRELSANSASPRYFPYFITVASLSVVFVILLLWLIYNRRLLPSIVMIGGFMLFVLWLVGLIVVSIELWGPSGSVSSNCNLAVFSQSPTGQSISTLAWLEQRSICQSWQAVFAFGLVGAIFLLWIMVMAYQVFADDS